MQKDRRRTAIITGAERGIGAAIAYSLACDGMNVVVGYYPSNSHRNLAETVAGRIRDTCGVGAVVLPLDVRKSDSRCQFVEKAQIEFGTADVLVNNAGVSCEGFLMQLVEEDIDTVLSVNLEGTVALTRLCLAPMIEQGFGRIVNLASIVGLRGRAGEANYATSKGAIIGFTQALSCQVAPLGVTVNALAPGFIETDMTATIEQRQRDRSLASIALGYFGDVNDVAYAARFFASPRAGYITGQVLTIDGCMQL